MASSSPSRPHPGEITTALRRWSAGETQAGDQVFQALYGEMHRVAAYHFHREQAGHTLQPTALIHETFLRLYQDAPREWADRKHFLAFAARVMRQVLVDHARGRNRLKRGAGQPAISISDLGEVPCSTDQELLELHDALERLAASDAEKASVVELRFFGGLEYDEIADILSISRATVARQMRRARAWLFTQLRPRPAAGLA